MPHTKPRNCSSQAQTSLERLNLRRQVLSAMWGAENALEGIPCARQPLVAAVCGCSSASRVLLHAKGRGICPLGVPWDCPGRAFEEATPPCSNTGVTLGEI